MRSRLGDALIQAGLISPRDLARAVKAQARSDERLGVVLVRLRIATEEQIAAALASQLGLQYADLSGEPIDPAAVSTIPKAFALREACVAIKLEKHVLTVAMADPLCISLMQDLEDQTACRIREVVATRSAILAVIETAYPEAPLDRPSQDSEAHSLDEPTSVDDIVDRIIRQAIANEADDVHVDPTGDDLVVRFRVDGVLREWARIPVAQQDDVVARFKILAGMDVAEKLLPQWGRLRLPGVDEGKIDMRAVTLRTSFGERVVLTARSHRRRAPSLDALGLSERALEDVRASLAADSGLVVVAGPSGSGRSATLAAALDVASRGRSAVTIEDAIEYEVPGVNHTQVSEIVGLTFTHAMRSVVHQRVDVILLGEMRDAETASMAADAARSGKLVLCPVTALDSNAAIHRLTELGIDPSSPSLVQCVIGQRLVRRLCPRCRKPYMPDEAMLRALDLPAVEGTVAAFRATACSECDYTGYRGRMGIFEVIRFTDSLRRTLTSTAAVDRVREIALQRDAATLAEDGLSKVASGVTSLEEVRRVVREFQAPRPVCAACGGVVAVEFSACPRCGQRLGVECPNCGRALEHGWAFCPFCATRAGAPAFSAKRGIIGIVRNPDAPGLV
ncbi:MAG TPA: ATPase, T2SS/T4P/T4SS family [Vicinamibacterales bacterium]